MKHIPETIEGAPALGYLVTYRIKESSISIKDFNIFLNGLYSSTEYEKSDVETLRVKGRQARHIYAAAVKKVRRLADDDTSNTRFFFRKAKAGGNKTERILVRETFTSGVITPSHAVIGRIRLSEDDQQPKWWTVANHEEEAVAIFEQVLTEFKKETEHFPSSSLGHRFSRVINDCIPIAYDAEHLFRFIFAEHKSALQLLCCVVDYINEQACVTNASRSKRSEVSVLPLPDLTEMRATITDAYKDEIQDAQANVQAALINYHKEKDTNKLMNTLSKIKDSIATLKEYDTKLKVKSGTVHMTLKELQKQARVLLGRDEQPATSHTFKWNSAKARIPQAQWALGDALLKLDDTYTVIRSHLECIGFKKGIGAAAVTQLVQVELQDWEEVHYTLPQVRAAKIPKVLKAVGFQNTISGVCYDGKPTDEVVAAIAAWWVTI